MEAPPPTEESDKLDALGAEQNDLEQEHTKMHKRHCLTIGLAAFFLCLCGCAPSLVPLTGETNRYELVVAKEQDVLTAVSEAIQRCFPDVDVLGLSGKEKGFTFSAQPFLDRPMYKFLIKKAYGMTPEGNDIVGYRYFIYSDSQLLTAEAKDAQRLVKEFKDALAKKGITIVWVQPVQPGR